MSAGDADGDAIAAALESRLLRRLRGSSGGQRRSSGATWQWADTQEGPPAWGTEDHGDDDASARGFDGGSTGGAWPGASEWEATVAALETRASAALRATPPPHRRGPWVMP